MRKITLFLLLIPSIATATPLPAGCYVADYYRTDPCWGESEALFSWVHSGDRTFEENYYGRAIETLVFTDVNEKAAKELCQANHNTLSSQFATSDAQRVAEYNSLNGQYNALVGEYNGLLGQLKTAQATILRLNKTIKKLKKK